MAALLSRLGAFAHRRRMLVVLVWLAVLIGGAAGAVSVTPQTSNSFSIPGQESTIALERIGQEFGTGSGATAQVVMRAPDGQQLTSPQNAAAVTTLVEKLGTLPGVASASNPLSPTAPTVNQQQNTAYSTVTYTAVPGEVTAEEQTAMTDALTAESAATGLTLEVTGEAAQAPLHIGGIAEILGVVVALVVLAITFGTLITAGMNLLTALIGVGVGVLGITIVTGFTELSSTTPILAAMLGLAVGIDYGLFIISRYRQELSRGRSVAEAIPLAVGTAGSAVVTAGITVVIALAGLTVVGIPFLTQMGLAAAATIVVAVLVALTLVPAVLSLLGRRVLPRRQRAAQYGAHAAPVTPREGRFLPGWIGTVTRHRVVALLLSVVALGAVAVPFASMQTTLIQTPPDGTTQARAQQLLVDGFGPGFTGPITVLFDGAGATQAAAAATPGITALADVVTVTPPIPNPAGTAALLTVVPGSGPTTEATETLVADLRAFLADNAGGTTASVTGATAVSVDVAQSLDEALPIYLLLVVGLALVLLILVFRSLLVPLVGVLGFLLTIGASLGATTAVFQWGWLGSLVNLESAGPLISLTPILVIGILFGLAMDYQIFLVSRMHEAHTRGESAAGAIRTGFRQAAPVVVAAALIMFSVFAGFVPAGDATIKSIAFALAAGILFDAFVVRMILVPAALALLGERAWWLPRWLQKLPHLDVEGSALTQDEQPSTPSAAGAGGQGGGATGADDPRGDLVGSTR
ncbi:MMPL family transporter [Nakamurella flavida]|uniref:MMPL family transporter n=1 Tax=Nakamurella flavida TaxID=363630 RepID=A0A938YLR8_9ACTN|nr:MMPL family transporter [Nakamurella flavida]MBM9475240.1 MMPL family transporter [Nakamurella flavida]MDP9776813.1 RND superfamily putative drug exporter [Nakamurella flavida]